MEQEPQIQIRSKKPITPTIREMNTSLFILRGLQVGLRITDFEFFEVGDIFDLLTESSNDSYDYPKKGTEEDFKALFGGK